MIGAVEHAPCPRIAPIVRCLDGCTARTSAAICGRMTVVGRALPYAIGISQADDRQHATLSGPSIFRTTATRFTMMTPIKCLATMHPTHPSAIRAFVGYMLAVTAAAACIIISTFPHVITQRASSGLLHPLRQTFLVLLSDCFLIVVIWLPAAFFSALPCVLLNLFVSRYRVRSPLLYALAGCALGLLAIPPISFTTSGWTWYADPPDLSPHLGFWQQFQSFAPVFALAGVFAGLTFWLVAGRYFSAKATSP